MKRSEKKSLNSLQEAFLDALERPADKSRQAAALGDEGERELFASPEESWRGARLLLSGDNMTVSLERVAGGRPLAADLLQGKLRELGIVHGIDRTALLSASEPQAGSGADRLILARGTLPLPRERALFSFLPPSTEPAATLAPFHDQLQLDFSTLKSVFSAPDLVTIQAASLTVKALSPGEPFLRLVSNAQPCSGKDVMGRPLHLAPPPLPQAGENVRFNESEQAFEAMVYGYLFIDPPTLAIVPPLWVSPERSAAYYIFLPQIAPFRYPTVSEIRHLLEEKGIDERCINGELLEKMVSQMAAGLAIPRSVKLAATVEPRHGQNASFTLFVDAEKKAGKILENGSIDLRERNAVVSICQGTVIAEKNPATKGKDGWTLFGKKIAAQNGKDYPITIGAGVTVQGDEEGVRYVAERTGNVKFSAATLSVADIHKINGDVDYGTGNIDITTDMVITGSVLSGFSVHSAGDIAILGGIENGAQIRAEGNLSVEKGIFGAETRIIVGGNLSAGFIQDAEVLVRGDVVIKSYLYNAKLIANGAVEILKGRYRKSGTVAGGIVRSAKKISLGVCGSAGYPTTVLAIRADPALSERLDKLEKELRRHEETIAKISRSLPFDSFQAQRIKEALATLTPERQRAIIGLLTNLNRLIKERKILLERVEQERRVRREMLDAARIHVREQLYPGSELHIGDQGMPIDAELGPSLFRLQEKTIIRS